LLFPEVMSFANEPPLAYRAGLSHPTVDNPAALLAALIRVIIPATVGVDVEVPSRITVFPPLTDTYL